MNRQLRGPLVYFGVFFLVCACGLFAITAVFGQWRFESLSSYRAVFTNISGLKTGDFVRVAGVEVGRVEAIDLRGDNSVVIRFGVDKSVPITASTQAAVRYENLIGDRYLALTEGAGPTTRLTAGAQIPAAHTSPALDLDALIGGFRPLFRALDPAQVNDLTSELIAVFQGQGGTIAAILRHLAELTSTLADRGELIGSVITNLDTVLATLAGHNQQFDLAVDKLQQLVSGLAGRSSEIGNAVGAIDSAAAGVGSLLSDARPPLHDTVAQSDRVATLIDNDRDYFENLIATLPDAYKILGRQGLYGDFFSFYLCDVALKVNGPNGNPMYIKVVGQDTGRCKPE
ncbi:mammalian cell entry protein [Nocardia nova]|uniref:Mammalian cell entry protein n=1 Tax=Nocardia nova TaxID=37330 RepID=A0A2S6AMV0_9NOCA|nr:MlaD family protein [Nocardia nova]PPJ36565.1 mammalian cell entry protein [Nocardia nova]